MFNKGQLAGLMKQAQTMQDNMKKAQDELGHVEVTGESGAGLVKVTMTCKHDVRRVTIDPSLLADDKDMLEDLVAAAFNAAVRKALEDPSVRKRIEDTGSIIIGNTPEQFAEQIKAEYAVYKQVVETAKLALD